MKKLLMAASAVALCGVGSAQAQEENFFGTDVSPYVGVYGGYGWSDAEEDTLDVDADLKGGDYGLYAGVSIDGILDQTVNRVGLGLSGRLEGHYGWSGQDDELGGADIEKENEWGISFKPGLSVIDEIIPVAAAPYAILGYRRTEYEVDGLGDEDYSGFELGVGAELLAYDRATVRLEYTHVFYNEKDDIDIDEDNIRLGLGYSF